MSVQIKVKGKSIDFDKKHLKASLTSLSTGLSVDVDQILSTLHLHLAQNQSHKNMMKEVTKICTDLIIEEPDYDKLATRWELKQLYKECQPTFSQYIEAIAADVDPVTKEPLKRLDSIFYNFIHTHAEQLDSLIDQKEDDRLNMFGLITIRKNYLVRSANRKIAELPQYLHLRVAVFLNMPDMTAIKKAYWLFSTGKMTHATPTLYNAGLQRPQLASCFVQTITDDSIEGIYETQKQCAIISKYAGGIGLSITKIRAKGSRINGTDGTSNGLVPMIRVFNNTARYVDQGGGKRKGAFALYVEPWHADIFEFLNLRKNGGVPEMRAPDLHYGLWVNDLLMKRVEEGKQWSFFCPHECPKLLEGYGLAWEEEYKKYEKAGRARRTMSARKFLDIICDAQAETGEPFMAYKDVINECCNQQNVGQVNSLNLCTEITLVTPKSKHGTQESPSNQIGVCNLCSFALNRFVKETKEGKEFDHTAFFDSVRFATKSLNRVIDRTFYPLPQTKESNLENRPIGMGVQGLADLLELLEFSYESTEARQLNKEIFETMYFAGLYSSNEEAKKYGPYPTYEGSPISKGILHFDFAPYKGTTVTSRWRWDLLRANIKKYGVRNSLLVAPMPTASTAHILGNSESFNPYKSVLFVRRTLTGNYVQVRPTFVKRMKKLKLWTPAIRTKIMAGQGSIQHITEIPQNVRELYKTVYEIELKALCDLALERTPFIDQSQSFNCYMNRPTRKKLRSFHMYMWKGGAKTGMYYNRSEAAQDAIPVTLLSKLKQLKEKETKPQEKPKKSKVVFPMIESQLGEEECLMCGS